MSLAPGTRIGAFEITSLLSAGGPAFARPLDTRSFGASTETMERTCW